MKILFLDIDGVLNSHQWFEERRAKYGFDTQFREIDPKLVALLDDIIEKTGCHIVLSSTWRLSSSWRADLEAQGLSTDFMIDRTPSMHRPDGAGVEYCERGREVLAWLEENPHVTKHAIVDDDRDFFTYQPLFRTRFETGLTREIADEIISHLNS